MNIPDEAVASKSARANQLPQKRGWLIQLTLRLLLALRVQKQEIEIQHGIYGQ